MASTYIKRTFGSTTNRRTFTYSVWVKRGVVNVEHNILSSGNFSGNPYLDARFNVDGTLEWYHYTTGFNFRLKTDRQFKDVSGWYHLVFATDTTQSTASNRCKLYVNGVQETSFSNEQYPSQDYDMAVNYSGYQTSFGSLRDGAVTYDGSMSHIHFIDGTQYAASDFGSTDSTTGEWKINTSPSVTYGTNGFFVLKDGNSVTDQSGNGNNLTVAGGTLTKTEDCPSNVFCTMSSIDKYAAGLSNGATTVSNENNNATIAMSTLAINSGKWYWEAKVGDSASDTFNVGVRKTGLNNYNVAGAAYSANAYVYAVNGYIYSGGTDVLNTGTTATVGDIISFILDMDAGTLKLKKNGSDIYSGNAVVTGLNTGDHWHVVQGASQAIVYFNFGNGYFGTTAVSSAGTNASGNGIFEYDVPTGFTALSTKGLNL